MGAPTGWVFADAWVLAAIGVYQRRCSLLEVIAAGDWMNHAVLERDEVGDALGKLVAAGLVRIFDDWTFELTDDGASMFSADVRSIQKQLDIIESSLAELELEPVRAKVAVPKDVMAQALADYREHQDGTSSH
jgi:hypothetical protein